MTHSKRTAGGRRGNARARKSTGLWLRWLRVQSPSLTPKTVSKDSDSSDLTAADRRQCRRLALAQFHGRLTYEQARAQLRVSP